LRYYLDINPDEIPTFETNVNNFCGESNSEQSNNQSDESGEEQYSKKRLRKRLLRRKEPCVVNQTNGETQLNANNDLSSDVVIVDEPYISRKKLKQQKDEATLKSTEIKPIKSNDGWTKVEQQQLEVAIRSIGKGTPERWDRITE
uniref:Myb-like domain-containing protein n=1 Tax=Schistosoma curassoni TaxID=6186 RepID=A0A183JJ62_9TREM